MKSWKYQPNSFFIWKNLMEFNFIKIKKLTFYYENSVAYEGLNKNFFAKIYLNKNSILCLQFSYLWSESGEYYIIGKPKKFIFNSFLIQGLMWINFVLRFENFQLKSRGDVLIVRRLSSHKCWERDSIELNKYIVF